MNPIEILLGALMGGGQAVKPAAKKGAMKKGLKLHGKDVANSGGRSNMYRPELLQRRELIQRQPMMPRSQAEIQGSPFRMFEDQSFQGMPPQMAKQSYNFYEDNTFSPFDTPANQFYPGRTNTGTPQDDMIDTSMGYLSPDQFNQGYRGQLQSRGFNPRQDYENRLRVR